MLNKITLEPIREFESIVSAQRFLNKTNGHQHIIEVCQGKRKSAYGYKWKYK